MLLLAVERRYRSQTVTADSGKPRSFILCEKEPERIYSNATTSLKYPLEV